MANNFDATKIVMQSILPKNDLLMDDRGMPSVMVWVPKFRLREVLSTSDTSTHPAFIVNGKEIDGFYFSKYQSKMYAGRAYSLPGEDPTMSIDLDSAVAQSRAKSQGWHQVTAAEYAAIALWCHKNGSEPKGNNYWGKDKTESDTEYVAIPTVAVDSNGRRSRVATGTGPLTWSHNGKQDGIWDLAGNGATWVSGVRMVYGELQIIANNNAADSECDLSESSNEWKAIDASTGNLVTPNGSGTTRGTVKLCENSGLPQWGTGNAYTSSSGSNFSKLTAESTLGDGAKVLLQALALLPDTGVTGTSVDTNYGNARFNWNCKIAEAVLARGACWYSLGGSIFGMEFSAKRTASGEGIGSRCCYLDVPDEG